ncbi:transporter [Furfurilactobacillus entadae]|uniref:transporter n=1 Tax=Furfurilactobacillus entadae TaxID=2922307 RepID=UPI0035EA1D27
MTKLKINMWTGILDIINCVLFTISWPVIFGTAFSDSFSGTNVTSGTAIVFYSIAWIGVILNIVALVLSRKHSISITGPVLGIIGSALFGLTAFLAFPALVVLIIGTVYTLMQRPAKTAASAN